jgi:hypothetical protein
MNDVISMLFHTLIFILLIGNILSFFCKTEKHSSILESEARIDTITDV